MLHFACASQPSFERSGVGTPGGWDRNDQKGDCGSWRQHSAALSYPAKCRPPYLDRNEVGHQARQATIYTGNQALDSGCRGSGRRGTERRASLQYVRNLLPDVAQGSIVGATTLSDAGAVRRAGNCEEPPGQCLSEGVAAQPRTVQGRARPEAGPDAANAKAVCIGTRSLAEDGDDAVQISGSLVFVARTASRVSGQGSGHRTPSRHTFTGRLQSPRLQPVVRRISSDLRSPRVFVFRMVAQSRGLSIRLGGHGPFQTRLERHLGEP